MSAGQTVVKIASSIRKGGGGGGGSSSAWGRRQEQKKGEKGPKEFVSQEKDLEEEKSLFNASQNSHNV